jgi:rhamnosyltransferase
MMATYNGEKYIREQLDSIVDQDYTNWKLLAQDDHSKDSTVDILTEYANRDKRISYKLSENSREGAAKNFHSLINSCKFNTQYDYYMFADQDDVWHKDKLSVMVDFMEQNSSSQMPSFVYANMNLIDGNGKTLKGTVRSVFHNEFHNKISYFFGQPIHGCNVMMNRKLLELTPDVDTKNKDELIMMHDSYFAKSAALNGEIFYIETPLMEYRRHGENTTASQEYNYGIKRILKRLGELEELSRLHAFSYSQTLEFIKKYHECGETEQQKEVLDKVEKIIRKGGIKGIAGTFKYHVTWGHPLRTVSHTGIMLLGRYKKYLLA